MRLMLVFLFVLILTACATAQNYQMALSSWQGASMNQLVRVWGYPNRESRAPDGNRLYVYHFEQKGHTPIMQSGGGTSVVQQGNNVSVSTSPTIVSGGGTYDLNCLTWVEVNHRGIIVNTAFRGNNCVATQDFLESHRFRQH